MEATTTVPRDIDEYIAGFPEEVRAILERVRMTIREAAPGAEEAIKYGMPTFVLHGSLVHFAAHTHHIGLYPAPIGVEEFRDELAPYAGGKGSARFPLEGPIPFDLIGRMVAFNVAKNVAKAKKR